MTLYLKRSTCKYYNYKMVCFRFNGSIVNPSKCNMRLCADHFHPYHDRGEYNSSHSSTINDEISNTNQV